MYSIVWIQSDQQGRPLSLVSKFLLVDLLKETPGRGTELATNTHPAPGRGTELATNTHPAAFKVPTDQ